MICKSNNSSAQYCIVLYLTVSVVSLIVETVKIVNLQGVPSMGLASEMEFGFPIETLGEKAYLISTHNHSHLFVI